MIKNHSLFPLLLLSSTAICAAEHKLAQSSEPLSKTQQNLEQCLGILTTSPAIELYDYERIQLNTMIRSNPLLPTTTPTEPATGSSDSKLVHKALEVTKQRAQAAAQKLST